ncbi:hypothetical protein Leryth_015499 [Lithospermum erythrorhizon]|nr:hypothetical protein Leryth_015499 [Lithospermum erythrorhizon]
METTSLSTSWNQLSRFGSQTAWEMLEKEESSRRITTSCADLDKVVGGGFRCNQVTEVGGVAGIGKTQLGIQLAVNVQIPADCGGLEGKAVYIDTEGSFMLERVLQIAQACVEDLHSSHRKMTPADFLDNIFYFRVCSYAEQTAVINYLETFVADHKDVKVVIIDSIAFHFRYHFDDMPLRTRLLGEIALKLMKLAQKFSLAVVLTNQVINKFADGSFHLTLALGDSWSHACTERIILFWKGSERYAYIDKSPSVRSTSVSYCVTERGIRNSSSNCKLVKMM